MKKSDKNLTASHPVGGSRDGQSIDVDDVDDSYYSEGYGSEYTESLEESKALSASNNRRSVYSKRSGKSSRHGTQPQPRKKEVGFRSPEKFSSVHDGGSSGSRGLAGGVEDSIGESIQIDESLGQSASVASKSQTK